MIDDKPATRSELIEAWIKMANTAKEDTVIEDGNGWAHNVMSDAVQDDPERPWPLILEILARDRSAPVVELLAAGPLEDLLAIQGSAFIDRIEAEAKHNPAFAKLLGGVWKNTMSDDIWARVQAVWDRRGWDGIPE